MKTYTLTEKELINELTCACAIGRKNALVGIVQGARKLDMPSLEDLEILLNGFESVVQDRKEKSRFATEDIYKQVEDALDRSTKVALLVSCVEALIK